MKQNYLSLIALVCALFFSCKKEASLSEANNLISFAVDGQLSSPIVDQTNHTINVSVSSLTNVALISCSFSVSNEAIVTINNIKTQGNSAVVDFSKAADMLIIAPSGNTSQWKIYVNQIPVDFGLGNIVSASKSINKTFEWYFDQMNTGQFSSVNCGPTVATMAIKWGDSTFNKAPEDARKTYRSTGGWWYTDDIVNYLGKYGINTMYTSLPDNYQTIKKYIDNNNIVILCLDNYYIRYNANLSQRVDKYYNVNAPASGHFIIVKGYKQVDNQFFFEVYDPWSYGASYQDTHQLKGRDRYYRSDDLEVATNIWWDYAIVVAPKGKSVSRIGSLNTKDQVLSIAPPQHGG